LDYTDTNLHPSYKTDGTFVLLPPEYCNPISKDFAPLPKILLGFNASPFQTRTPGFEKPSRLLFFFVLPKRLKVSLRGQAMLKRVLAFNNFFCDSSIQQEVLPSCSKGWPRIRGLKQLGCPKNAREEEKHECLPNRTPNQGYSLVKQREIRRERR
jgi:hypothetical protein